MINKRKDVNQPNSKGYTPLNIARTKGHKDIVSLLSKNPKMIETAA